MQTVTVWRGFRGDRNGQGVRGEEGIGCGGWDFAFAFAFGGRVGEGFNFVRDYYFGFNSSFYGSLGIIMNSGVAGWPWAHNGGRIS